MTRLSPDPDADGIIMRAAPSPFRRVFAWTVLMVLGALLIWFGVVEAAPAAVRAALVTGGAMAIWAGERLRRLTWLMLVLTDTELRDGEGRVLARIDAIDRVERGAFAMKPPNGFLLMMKEPGPRVWVPGIWWRMGRRVGVGGMLPPHLAKHMAETIGLMLIERDAAART
ncbi:hypothetical protein [Limimaricola sp.]|uniref:hypothetical protein n=1 Tax=Limimaricola sp. TaxID=2211665 RepID=UPI0025C727AB|nr:hypothetical protein [Limimaricola sp.]